MNICIVVSQCKNLFFQSQFPTAQLLKSVPCMYQQVQFTFAYKVYDLLLHLFRLYKN